MCSSFDLIPERKGSKSSIINTDEIGTNTQTALAAVTDTVTSSLPQWPQIPMAGRPPRTTVHEKNEKTGETNDVSDKIK